MLTAISNVHNDSRLLKLTLMDDVNSVLMLAMAEGTSIIWSVLCSAHSIIFSLSDQINVKHHYIYVYRYILPLSGYDSNGCKRLLYRAGEYKTFYHSTCILSSLNWSRTCVNLRYIPYVSLDQSSKIINDDALILHIPGIADEIDGEFHVTCKTCGLGSTVNVTGNVFLIITSCP